jgi:Cd2+/Zn2+-exporting ATPase
MNLSPKEALTRREGAMVVVPVEDLKLGDVVVVRPGERIPTDGMVIEGQSSVDQSSITGESMPVSKQPGEDVLGGTINQSGSLDIEVTKLAKDSTIAKMIRLVEVAQSEKARTQRFLEKFEQYYAVGVIGVTLLLVFVPTLVLGEAFNTAFYRAMTVMCSRHKHASRNSVGHWQWGAAWYPFQGWRTPGTSSSHQSGCFRQNGYIDQG